MRAPQGYSQVIDSRAYTAAKTACSRRAGVLRLTLPMTVLSAALLSAGGLCLWQSAGRLTYVLTAVLLLLCAAAVAVLWHRVLPSWIQRKALLAYRTFDGLQNPVNVTFTQDDMTLEGKGLTRTVAFAKTRLCIETPKRFVVLTDEEYTVILEKACFTAREETERFLRDVFARRTVKEKHG